MKMPKGKIGYSPDPTLAPTSISSAGISQSSMLSLGANKGLLSSADFALCLRG